MSKHLTAFGRQVAQVLNDLGCLHLCKLVVSVRHYMTDLLNVELAVLTNKLEFQRAQAK